MTPATFLLCSHLRTRQRSQTCKAADPGHSTPKASPHATQVLGSPPFTTFRDERAGALVGKVRAKLEPPALPSSAPFESDRRRDANPCGSVGEDEGLERGRNFKFC